ncbi:hypothetical protein LTR85_002812 [Meristemomyces frigidus]|nr:hypothetical protein LTR85_002812 [Meristemomyces frigidus]
MSQSTPIKQCRVERHLMRQRGAGARPVNATFGFNIPLDAPSSSDPTAIDEPPTKRRKTIVLEHPLGTETATGQEQHQDGSRKEQNKKTKGRPRRKLPIDVDDAPQVIQRDVGEDSFMATARTKRGRTKAKQSGPIAVEEPAKAEVVTVPVKGRPGRRAAVKPVAKVTDALLEEATPIDEKCEQEPITAAAMKPKRARKKQVIAEEDAAAAEVHIDPEEAPLFEPEIAAKPVRGKRGKKAAVGQPRASRRDVATTEAPDVCCDVEAAEPPEVALDLAEPTEPTRDATVMVFSTPVATKKRQRATSAHRQPLLEADVNILRPSVSPEKLEKITEKPKRAVGRTKRKPDAKPATCAKSAKRRKLHVERDEGVEVDDHDVVNHDEDMPGSPSPQPETKGARESKRRRKNDQVGEKDDRSSDMVRESKASDVRAHHSPSPTPDETEKCPTDAEASPTEAPTAAVEPQQIPAKRPLLRRDPETGHPARRETVRTVKHKTSPGLKRQLFSRPAQVPKPTEQSAATPQDATEQDIDWLLFAPIEFKRAPSHSCRMAAKRKSFSKLADVDLDDLVTNIASFAQAVRPGVKSPPQRPEGVGGALDGGGGREGKAAKGRRRK